VAGKSESRSRFPALSIFKRDYSPDEWREKVSPVITFPRLIAKSWSAFSKSRLPPKKPSHFQKADCWLFGAKNRQMSQL
jgi:hypothetical protein